MVDDNVLTPGGLRPRSQVFHVEPGAILDGGGGRLRKLHPSGRVLQDYGVIPGRPAGRPVMPHNIVRAKKLDPAFGSGLCVMDEQHGHADFCVFDDVGCSSSAGDTVRAAHISLQWNPE